MIVCAVECDICGARPTYMAGSEHEARRDAETAGFVRKQVDGRWVDLCHAHRLTGSRKPAVRLRDR